MAPVGEVAFVFVELDAEHDDDADELFSAFDCDEQEEFGTGCFVAHLIQHTWLV